MAWFHSRVQSAWIRDLAWALTAAFDEYSRPGSGMCSGDDLVVGGALCLHPVASFASLSSDMLEQAYVVSGEGNPKELSIGSYSTGK